MATTAPSSNWKALQAKLKKAGGDQPQPAKRKLDSSKEKRVNKKVKVAGGVAKPAKTMLSTATAKSIRRTQSTPNLSSLNGNSKNSTGLSPVAPSSRPPTSHNWTTISTKGTETISSINEGVSTTALAGRYIALDCEMVGVGPNPEKDSQLARVSLVNYHGEQIYDSYVLPTERVTDYRTAVSGIRARDLKEGIARPFKEVQEDVSTLLANRILVGHALKNDLSALLLSHPRHSIRDTARYMKFRNTYSAGRAPSLRKLAREVLGVEVQGGEHSSIEDARVAMLLYRQEKDGFEAEAQRTFGVSDGVDRRGERGTATITKARKKKKKKR